MYFNNEKVLELSLGTQVLGGGGGGRRERGLKSAADAMAAGEIQLLSINDLSPDDIIVTVSGVGAPSQKGAMYTTDHYLRALELLEQQLQKPIAGFIPSEMGASSAFGPFVAAAAKGVPVIDAACDGRAHPLGTMGAIGLDRNPNYQTLQVACGGKVETGTYTEMIVRGTIPSTSGAIRMAAQMAGGLAAVMRNPANAEYVRKNAAIGCYTQAMHIGKAVSAATSPLGRAEAAAEVLQGQVAFSGTICEHRLMTTGGLDYGYCVIDAGGAFYKLYFYNEFMAMEQDGRRLHTFPDLMTAFDLDSGNILPTADLKQGQRIAVLTVPYQNLILPAGLKIPAHYDSVEKVLGIPIRPYIASLFQ